MSIWIVLIAGHAVAALIGAYFGALIVMERIKKNQGARETLTEFGSNVVTFIGLTVVLRVPRRLLPKRFVAWTDRRAGIA